MSIPRKRTVILISGRGSNMAALIQAVKEQGFPAEIVGVIADRAEAAGLQAAQSLGIATRVVARAEHDTDAGHDKALDAAIARMKAEIVCLAGYMRVLTPALVAKWQGRLINIHPALLPSFRGLHTHRRALAEGVRLHGCTVHFVTSEVDAGPIIAQAAVPVLIGDREPALAARVLKAEHKLYPLALALVAGGKVRLDGQRAVFDDIDQAGGRSGTLMSPASWHGPSDLEDLARITP